MSWNVVVYYATGLVKAAFKADVTAPPVPTGLDSPSQTPSSISLQWNESVDPPGAPKEVISGTSSYTIYRDGSPVRTQVGLSYTDVGLQSSRLYSYQVLATDNAGNSSALSAPYQVSTSAPTGYSYPTAEEMWADAPPWPTEAQILSSTEWELNSWTGVNAPTHAYTGIVVDMYPHDEGHPNSMTWREAVLKIKNESPSQGGMIRVHYGTSGVHKVFPAGHPEVVANNEPFGGGLGYDNYKGRTYVVGIPNANGDRPKWQGQYYGTSDLPIFWRADKGSDLFIKDLIIEQAAGSNAIDNSARATVAADGVTILNYPKCINLWENVDVIRPRTRAIFLGPEWKAGGQVNANYSGFTDQNMRDLRTLQYNAWMAGETEKWIKNECWFKNVLMARSQSGASHLAYLDRHFKTVIVNTIIENPTFSINHAIKIEAQYLYGNGNLISNVNRDGTLFTETEYGEHQGGIYKGAVGLSLLAGQQGYFCNSTLVDWSEGSFGGKSIHQQARHGIHGLEEPDPFLIGVPVEKRTDSPYWDPAYWTGSRQDGKAAENWTMHFYDNHHIKVGPDKEQALIYVHSGTWPLQYSNPAPQLQIDNELQITETGQTHLRMGVPAEWWDRGQAIVAGNTLEGWNTATWTAFEANWKQKIQSQADTLDDRTVNPTDDVNFAHVYLDPPRGDGTGVGRYTLIDDFVRTD